ncbi:MAG: GGDEF domain-containing protein [Solobacterium sp.]|nr:GGDEF domain-containing protein [Solobacterium sp.]
MMYRFSIFYIEANLVCSVVFGILLLHNYFNIDRQEKQIKFDQVLISFIFYFLVDCLWAAIIDGYIPKSRPMMIFECFLIYISMAATMYFWLQFVLAYEQVPHRNRKINKFAVLFPFIVSTLAMILNFILAPDVLLNANNDTLPAYNIYLVAVPYIYMGAILFYTLRKAHAEESISEKRKHIFIGIFPLMVIAGGLIQMMHPYIPIYCFTVLILMLLFYIQSIELRISMDPLTNLNNRGQLTRYVAQESNLHMEGRDTVLIMMDIDGFKQINDTYGHAEGDKALVRVSNALKRTVNKYSMPMFLGRYGGDEFILIIHPTDPAETDQLIQEIRKEVAEEAKNMPNPVGISIGYDTLGKEEKTIQNCLRRADNNLYKDKKERKSRASETAARF